MRDTREDAKRGREKPVLLDAEATEQPACSPALIEQMLTPIKKGGYDLANISTIGHDPVSGKSYEECHQAWVAALAIVRRRVETCPWWNVPRRIRNARLTVTLQNRLGM